jgi:predicted nuclease of predicted toxin-antitoxin system
MNLRSAAFLADENIHSAVAAHLRASGHDVKGVASLGSVGLDDVSVMRLSVAEGRVILTHDRDFGRLAVAVGEPFVGIVYLRPGHILPAFTIGGIEALLKAHPEVVPPFIAVVRRQGDRIAIRIRTLRHDGVTRPADE